MNTALLSIMDGTVKLNNSVIFDRLNMTMKYGESWAVVGESGSGKSILLQVIAGKLHLSSGNIRYYFQEEYPKKHTSVNSRLPFHRLIALVEARHHFRNLANTSEFYYQQRYNSSDSEDALTVEKYLSATSRDFTPGYWTLEKVVHRFKLENLKTKQLIKLSNGETRRLLIAAALLKNPVLLLLDNPLAGLDVQTREEFSAVIGDITASGINLIMSASPADIPAAITHVAILQKGEPLKQIPLTEFDPAVYRKAAHKKTDKTELSLLLKKRDAPPYKWIVKMNRVNITYGDKVVLRNVDWQIKQGERWALLGPNGAGKSTLLSLINGDNPQAYANDIILFDRKRGTGESIWDIKSRTGFMSPELYQYFPTESSCLQVIESGFYDTMGLFRQSDPKKAEIAGHWMKTLEIDQYAQLLLKNIPASAQRLCLLARALIKNPPLLIFDEPCQGLDTHQQQHFKTLVDTICELSDVTLIYVTHYDHEIPESVDRVLRLYKGKILY